MKMSHLPDILRELENGDPSKVHIRLVNYAKAHFDDIKLTQIEPSGFHLVKNINV